jgi:galactonate dehydratase
VLIATDRGITGLGEASLGGQTRAVLGMVEDLKPLLIDADLFRIELIWQQAYRHAFWHGGVTFLSALSGVEVALWDIKGQALGVPIWQMMGGLVRDRIRAYANGPRGDTPDELARSAADLVAQGYSALKFTPFDATPILVMLRRREGARLEAWLAKAEASDVEELMRFAAKLRTDQAAVQAGLTLRHSNGQTEGHVTKLKLVKRQGYGRAKVDLLRQRRLRAA